MIVVLGERPQQHSGEGQQPACYPDEEQSDGSRARDLTPNLNDEEVECAGRSDGDDDLDHANRRVPAPIREPSNWIVGAGESVAREECLPGDDE